VGFNLESDFDVLDLMCPCINPSPLVGLTGQLLACFKELALECLLVQLYHILTETIPEPLHLQPEEQEH
jgi:hypothetical protein